MTNQTEPAEVAIPPAAADYPVVKNWLRKLDLEAISSADSKAESVMQIVNNILNAEDESSLFEAQTAGVLNGKDFTNHPFRLTSDGVSWRRSAFEESPLPFYAFLTILDLEDGETKNVACGGVTFMTVLSKLIDLGSLDRAEDEGQGRPLQLVTKKTQAGYDVLMIMPVNLNGKTAKSGTKG